MTYKDIFLRLLKHCKPEEKYPNSKSEEFVRFFVSYDKEILDLAVSEWIDSEIYWPKNAELANIYIRIKTHGQKKPECWDIQVNSKGEFDSKGTWQTVYKKSEYEAFLEWEAQDDINFYRKHNLPWPINGGDDVVKHIEFCKKYSAKSKERFGKDHMFGITNRNERADREAKEFAAEVQRRMESIILNDEKEEPIKRNQLNI